MSLSNLKRKVAGTKYEAPVVAFVAANIGTIATVVSVAGSLMQASQQKKAADYNAQMAQQQSVAAQQQAAAQADTQRRRAQRQIGSMEASYAASGLSLEGSPLEVLEQSARDAELDRQNILYGGSLRSTGYQNTASLESAKGQNAMTSGFLRAGSTLLSGMSSSYTGTSNARSGIDTGSYGSVYNTELPESDLWRAG